MAYGSVKVAFGDVPHIDKVACDIDEAHTQRRATE